MLKNTSDLSCREDGFTLIELLIVIVIIGILAAIAIPVFLSQAQNARNASVDSDARNAASRVAQEVAEKGFPTVAADVTTLEGKLIKSNGNNVKIASAGGVNYTVTAWNDDTAKYTVIFTSADGKFAKDTTTAEAASASATPVGLTGKISGARTAGSALTASNTGGNSGSTYVYSWYLGGSFKANGTTYTIPAGTANNVEIALNVSERNAQGNQIAEHMVYTKVGDPTT